MVYIELCSHCITLIKNITKFQDKGRANKFSVISMWKLPNSTYGGQCCIVNGSEDNLALHGSNPACHMLFARKVA